MVKFFSNVDFYNPLYWVAILVTASIVGIICGILGIPSLIAGLLTIPFTLMWMKFFSKKE